MVDAQGLFPLRQIDREEEAPARNEGATIIRHVGENSTFVSPALEIEAADYAFRLRSPSYGGQVGSNPSYAPIHLTCCKRSPVTRCESFF